MRLKVYWLFCGDWWWDRLQGRVSEPLLEKINTACERLQKPLCRLMGHIAIRDNCNIPDHDYCMACQRSMPNAAH